MTTTKKQRLLIVLLIAFITATFCVSCGAAIDGDGDVYCTAIYIPGMNVSVYDNETLEPIFDANAYAIDANDYNSTLYCDGCDAYEAYLEDMEDPEYAEYMEGYGFDGEAIYYGADKGDYTLYVEASGYTTHIEEVEVTGGVCHPNTETIEVYLTIESDS